METGVRLLISSELVDLYRLSYILQDLLQLISICERIEGGEKIAFIESGSILSKKPTINRLDRTYCRYLDRLKINSVEASPKYLELTLSNIGVLASCVSAITVRSVDPRGNFFFGDSFEFSSLDPEFNKLLVAFEKHEFGQDSVGVRNLLDRMKYQRLIPDSLGLSYDVINALVDHYSLSIGNAIWIDRML